MNDEQVSLPFLKDVDAALRASRDDLLDLVRELVAFDTTGRLDDEPARDEAALQEHLSDRLKSIGARVDMWEPDIKPASELAATEVTGFSGRPQMTALLPGQGGGRSLLLAGHIDCVSVEPRAQWTNDPFVATERDGRVFGRGVADMKGGIAALIIVLETLSRLDVQLLGDVTVATVTDEETSGVGSLAVVERGVAADAGLVPEPTGFNAWIACRGGLSGTVKIPGRAGHADIPQPHWSAGGAVNAIERLDVVFEIIRRVRDLWSRQAPHPLLSRPDIVPTIVRGGDWEATYPAECSLTCEVAYLPAALGNGGPEASLRRDVERLSTTCASSDPWLASHPLEWTWSGACHPAEIPADSPLVHIALAAGEETGRPGKIRGLDSWHDAANFTRFGGTPTFSYGPATVRTGHTVDEWLDVEELVDYCCALARIVMRWCGVSKV